MAKVSLIKGPDRYKNISESLESIEDQIKLDGKKVFIKPNFTSVTRQLASTHADAVKAVLDFVSKFNVKEIVIGEGTGAGDTFIGFRNFNYFKLKKDYGVELIDLNQDDYEWSEILDENFKLIKIKIAKTPFESDFRISVSPLKTHDFVIVTLGLKNLVVGSIVGKDKTLIHQGYPAMNLNIFKLGKILYPHLSVLDGFEGMGGNGPVEGEKVELKIALASTDFVACDALATKIMGFEPRGVGYLYYCERSGLGTLNLNEIKIVGEEVNSVKTKFKPHSKYNKQRNWKIKEEDEILKKLQ